MKETVEQDVDGDALAWPQLAIDRSRRGSLVDQIVASIALMVNGRELRVGTKMPSVRQFAKCNGVSTFTVVESYDRLLNLGLLSSRRGSGFFVARNDIVAPTQLALQPGPASIDALAPDLYSGVSDALPVGAGWLPAACVATATRWAFRHCASTWPPRCPTSCSRASRTRCC